MIISFFLSTIYSLVNLIVGILPTGSLPSGFSTGLSYLWGIMNTFSYVLPVDTILQALIVALTFDAVILVWHFIHWGLRKIPFLHIQ